MPLRTRSFATLVALLAAACIPDPFADKVHPMTIQDGTYQVSPVPPSTEAEAAPLRALRVRIDRATRSFTLTVADGSQQALEVSFRPASEWKADCFTMASHVLEETAGLTPAPLLIEGYTFNTPMIYRMCWEGRVILSDGHPSDHVQQALPALVLDLQVVP